MKAEENVATGRNEIAALEGRSSPYYMAEEPQILSDGSDIAPFNLAELICQ